MDSSYSYIRGSARHIVIYEYKPVLTHLQAIHFSPQPSKTEWHCYHESTMCMAILKCIISCKQKACSCTSSTTGAAYSASGA